MYPNKYECKTRSGSAHAKPYGHDLLNSQDLRRKPLKMGWVRVTICQSLDNIKNKLKNN